MSEQKRPELADQVKVVGEAWAQSVYYDNAERWTHLFWHPGTEFRCLFDKLDLSWTVELACGHGRHSEQIARRAKHIAMVDIFDQNLEFCRKRLQKYANIEFLKGDGTTFPVDDETASAVFCYDAMVHFSPDMVAAYLADTRRILRHGGMALYHHSNYAAPLDRHYGQNPHARNHMTQPLFSEYARQAGLEIVKSVVIPWGGQEDLDAVALLRK